MNFDITPIIEIVITLFSALISSLLIPALKERLTQEKREKLKFWVDTAVKAAEQLYGGKTGKAKKEYVVSFLLAKGIVFDVDEVTALIESSVYELTGSAVQEAA